MTDPIETRLLQAFHTLFPSYTWDALRTGTPDSLAEWDSTNHFVLLELIEETFEIRIPERDGGELLSFAAFAAYLTTHSTIR